jgi:hypothetical protein
MRSVSQPRRSRSLRLSVLSPGSAAHRTSVRISTSRPPATLATASRRSAKPGTSDVRRRMVLAASPDRVDPRVAHAGGGHQVRDGGSAFRGEHQGEPEQGFLAISPTTVVVAPGSGGTTVRSR